MQKVKALIGRGIDALQNAFPPNRIVVLLTPLVFVPAAGFVSAYVAQRIPGITLNPTEITGIFAAGALAAFLKANKWLNGWQKEHGMGR